MPILLLFLSWFVENQFNFLSSYSSSNLLSCLIFHLILITFVIWHKERNTGKEIPRIDSYILTNPENSHILCCSVLSLVDAGLTVSRHLFQTVLRDVYNIHSESEETTWSVQWHLKNTWENYTPESLTDFTLLANVNEWLREDEINGPCRMHRVSKKYK